MGTKTIDCLDGKVIIITGAASGIGRACAFALSPRGSRLALVDINAERLENTQAALERLNDATEVLSLRLDAASECDMAEMAEHTLARFGRIDGLVAAAGILRVGGALKTVRDMTLDEWRTILTVNLTGTFLSNRAVLPAMIAQKQGDIVNFSSVSGRQGRAFDAAYCATKFGIIGFSEALAEEVSSYGVRVQTILPDAVDTPLWDQNGPAAMRAPLALRPERVAEFICYLLELPRDAYLLNPVIAPFGGSRKRKGGGRRGRGDNSSSPA